MIQVKQTTKGINHPAKSCDQINICLALLSHCAPSAHWWYIRVHAFTTRTPSLAQRPWTHAAALNSCTGAITFTSTENSGELVMESKEQGLIGLFG